VRAVIRTAIEEHERMERPMKNRPAWIWIAALLVAGVAVEASAAMLTVSPQASSATVGAPIAVDVLVSGLVDGAAPSLGAYDVAVAFDGAVLALSGVDFGSGLDLAGLGSIRNFDATVAGTVSVFEVSLDEIAALDLLQSGSFRLFTLLFDASAVGTSALSLSINALGDAAGSALTAGVTNSTVSVSAVPLPAAAWLLLSGIGGLGMLRRRRG
jgi:hypothetical protein